MRNPYRAALLAAVIITLTVTALAPADTLTLDSGETFTGQLSRIIEGTLVFRTALSGQMMVPMDTVQRLTTERNLVVTTRDGNVQYGRLDFGGPGGGEHLAPLGGDGPVPLALADIVEAEPLRSAPAPTPETTVGTAKSDGPTVTMETGAQWREGNDGRLEPVGRLQLSGGGEGSPVTAEIEAAQSGSDVTPGYVSGSLQVTAGASATGPYARVDALRNADAALALRARLGLGLRHLLYEGETSELSLSTGGAAMLEQWDAGLVPHYRERLFEGGKKSSEDIELELELRYSRMVFGSSRIEETVGFYPSLTQPGEFRASSETVLRVPLNDLIQLRLNLRLYYESDPPFAGLDPWETSVGAGLAVEF
jgi:hypothetical protein